MSQPLNPHHPRTVRRMSASMLAAAELLGAAAILLAVAVMLGHVLLWNISPSVPRGLYLLRRGASPTIGAMVTFSPPPIAAALIEGRRYLPRSVGLLKRVVALPGDHVCVHGCSYEVNGVRLANIATTDSLGRRLDLFPFCGVVPDGEAFMFTSAPLSFDSRYFGPVPLLALTVAVPLWTY